MENPSFKDLPRKRYHSDHKNNAPIYQELCEALKKVWDIVEERIDEINMLLAARNGSERSKLLNERKGMDGILKLLRNGGKAGESEVSAASDDALIVKEGEITDAIRKVLIEGLKNMTSPNPIGVKRMGDIDCKPFYEAMKRLFKKDDSLRIALNMCHLWNECIKDIEWFPFKVIELEGKSVVVVDNDDKKLKAVKKEMGKEVCNAITNALMEMHEYDPIGRSTVPELWNFNQDRKASLTEVITFLLNQREKKKRARLLP